MANALAMLVIVVAIPAMLLVLSVFTIEYGVPVSGWPQDAKHLFIVSMLAIALSVFISSVAIASHRNK